MMYQFISDPKCFNAGVEHPTIGLTLRHLIRGSGKFRPSEMIDRLARLESFPSISVGALISAANRSGQSLKGLAVDLSELDQLKLPVIAYLRRSPRLDSPIDLIRVERIGRTRVQTSSDDFGKTYIDWATLQERWAGIVIVCDEDAPNGGENEEIVRFREQVENMPEFISKTEREGLIEYCEKKCFRRSRVMQKSEAGRLDVIATSVRSSSSVTLLDRHHPTLAKIYEKCAVREGVKSEDIENIQCVRYKRGQRFRAHFDGASDLPRLTTYLLYLNDDFDGGETFFTFLDMKVKPVAGECLRFSSCDREGRVLWASEHGGLPVSSGIKYALNIWVRCPI